jgi:hypothetical protein
MHTLSSAEKTDGTHEYAPIYRMRNFWVDIRNGEHDKHLEDALKACITEINDRKKMI